MAITHVNSGTAANSIGTGTLSPTLPGSMAAGDLMLCFVVQRYRIGTISLDQSWSSYNSWAHSAQDIQLHLWYKIHTGSESAPTVTITAGSLNATVIAHIAAFRGVNTSSPFTEAGTLFQTGSTIQNIGAITGIVIAAGAAVLVLGGKADDWTAGVGTLSGDSLTWTEIGDVPSTTGTDAGLVWDLGVDGGSGTTVTSKTFAPAGGGVAHSVGIMLELAIASTPVYPGLERTFRGVHRGLVKAA